MGILLFPHLRSRTNRRHDPVVHTRELKTKSHNNRLKISRKHPLEILFHPFLLIISIPKTQEK